MKTVTHTQMLDTPANVGSGATARLEPREDTVCAGERVENSLFDVLILPPLTAGFCLVVGVIFWLPPMSQKRRYQLEPNDSALCESLIH